MPDGIFSYLGVIVGFAEYTPCVGEIAYANFSSHSQILDVAGQRRFAPWPPANFNREYACKQSIHVEMWQVLNRYHIHRNAAEGM